MQLNTMDVTGRQRARDTMDAMDTLDEPIEVREKRGRAESLRLAPASDKDVVEGRAQWPDSLMRDKWNVVEPSLLEGVDAAISTWAAH